MDRVDPQLVEGFTDAPSGTFIGFTGTAQDCFDATGGVTSPRPGNGLQAAGKI